MTALLVTRINVGWNARKRGRGLMEQEERGVHRAASVFLSLPSTRIGRWSGYLLLLGVVLVVLNSAVIMPVTESREGLGTVQMVANVAVGSCVVAAGVLGLFAVLAKRERSWALLLSIVILVLVAMMIVQDLVTPGQ